MRFEMQNRFQFLPSEITTEIPLRGVAISKCVCKSWLNLLESHDFVKSHLPQIKTPLALARLTPAEGNSTRCTIFEIEDESESDPERHDDLHYIPLMDLNIPHSKSAFRSMAGVVANGLLLLQSELVKPETPIYICNPLTRQYIELCCPDEYISDDFMVSLGFGMSEISGQYKVVCINAGAGSDSHYVYTLGTGTWRRVEAGAASGFRFYLDGHVVCNGNFHWTVHDLVQPSLRICGFDVETERFSIFSAPLVGEDGPLLTVDDVYYLELSVLRDCLCFSYTLEDEIVIWLMKEYRVEESWTILYKISSDGFDFGFNCPLELMPAYPIKLFKDGDVLMLLDERLIYHYNKTRTTREVGIFINLVEMDHHTYVKIFTPSLFSLKSFGIENVISF